jgi:hypothetical protein
MEISAGLTPEMKKRIIKAGNKNNKLKERLGNSCFGFVIDIRTQARKS